MTTEDKYKNLDRVNYWISNCDSKVSYLLTLEGIILTIIFTSNYSKCLIDTFSYEFTSLNKDSFFRLLESLTLYVFSAMIIISLYNAYLTLRPRLNPKVFKEAGLSTKSVLFFESIANRTFAEFIATQQSYNSTNKLEKDIDSQVFINSKICQLKFKHYNYTLKYCSIGFLMGLIYLILTIKNGC